MPDVRSVRSQADEFGTPPSSPSPPSKPKRVRATRRPRYFPVPIRQKLSLLGHALESNETNQGNLTLLVNRLTADLHKYRALADRWQKQYIELENHKGEPLSYSTPVDASSSFGDEFAELASSPRSMEEISSFGTHILGKLDSTANPSLSLVGMGAPRVYSDVSTLVEARSAFRAVLAAADLMSALHTRAQHIMQSGIVTDRDYFPRIHYRKPDFDTQKARKVWNDIFAPMNFQPATVAFNAAPSCRTNDRYIDDDPDIDHFDRVMAQSTDYEIIDMLHYTTLLIGGMHQAVFDDPSLAPARAHLGRSCERLLREVIFTRNLTAKSAELGQSLMDGLVGTFCHFSTHGMTSAVSSILELAWLLYSKNPNGHDPMMRVFLSFFALVLAPSESKRIGWMQHISEALRLSSQSKSFAALVLGSFGVSYNALLTHDEGTFLRYATILEEVLAPGHQMHGEDELWDFVRYHATQPRPPFTPSWNDSPHTAMPIEDYPAAFNCGYSFVHLPAEDSRSALVSHASAHSPSLTACPCIVDLQNPEYTSSMHFLESVDSEELLENWASPSFLSEDSPDALSQHPETQEQVAHYSFLDEKGDPYVPGENLKSIYRITFLLMRAEAALTFQDHETCIHWVDEAEKLLISIPLDYMFQRVFLMKNVIKTTCHFPTGTRTVVDEFERRLLLHDTARCPVPPPSKASIGALWRTP